jgi:antitoxin (DNA-binding transcriptional repressor) of toxin-antitoxin stability system
MSMQETLEVNATYFRKHLFEILDQALHGEAVEITYKGSTLRLTPQSGQTKLSRAVRRHALLVDPQSIVESDAGFLAKLEKGWRRDDKSL